MRSVDVVEVLPDRELLAKVDVVGVLEELIELELIGEMGALHLAVEVGAPRLDVDVPHALVFHVPMELGLELMAIVGSHGVDAEGKARNDMVDEVDGVLLGVAVVDLSARIRVASSTAVNW